MLTHTVTDEASSSEATSETETRAAGLKLGTPSASYTGPASVAVYYDTVFGIYAFVSTN